jgi:hypothetical protein
MPQNLKAVGLLLVVRDDKESASLPSLGQGDAERPQPSQDDLHALGFSQQDIDRGGYGHLTRHFGVKKQKS